MGRQKGKVRGGKQEQCENRETRELLEFGF